MKKLGWLLNTKNSNTYMAVMTEDTVREIEAIVEIEVIAEVESSNNTNRNRVATNQRTATMTVTIRNLPGR